MTFPVFSQKTRFVNNQAFPMFGFFLNQNNLEPHQQEFFEIVFILHGEADHYTETEKWHPIRRGDVWIIPTYGIHGFRNVQNLQIFNLLFVPDKLPMPLLDLYAHPAYKKLFSLDCRYHENIECYPHLKLTSTQIREMESMLKHFYHFHETETPGRNPGKYGLFMALISRLCDLSGYQIPPKEEGNVLDTSKIIRYLNENYATNIGIPELQRHLGMSETSLRRYFLHAFGMSPVRYIRKFRLKIAEKLLFNTRFSIKEIVQLSGFNGASYFGKMFRAEYHMTPEEYRIRAKSTTIQP